jgi:hypothetical protein
MLRTCLLSIGIEIYSADRGLVLFFVSTRKTRSSAALGYPPLKVRYEGATNSAALPIRTKDERMQLPRVSAVVADASDPSDGIPVFIKSDAAQAIGAKRFSNLGNGCYEVRKSSRSRDLEAINQQPCDLPNDGILLSGEVRDFDFHFLFPRAQAASRD